MQIKAGMSLRIRVRHHRNTSKPGNTVSITGDAASGVTVTNTGNDITVGLGNQVTIGSGDNAVSIDGNAGTIQVGDIHIDGSKGNITAGQVKVNGEAGTVNGLTNTTWNPGDIVSGQAATENPVKTSCRYCCSSSCSGEILLLLKVRICRYSKQKCRW